ncbi:Acyl-CoA N-acyltransferase [Penicillium expansum]|uniref:Acyl-CoA N-acyltransferase n=1 Tax=Penicillium expansum TaxID=27334 RepID=A0A0A2INE7_PENEN|nr:Acyl-CoA N-acyltransferase [Penicillium expansum]KGO41750.1 Acyl-CoA N-acyltransferase [Penicillium expansum]KGO52120.1 Acyl-CoA N-acyltransferase [Penicillium expansum]KGO56695.1 Acyl-CoA N-acyltransferase [Penicillium expansum]
MPFIIQPCFPEDAPGLAATMMGARLTDHHWKCLWDDPSAERIIPGAIERLPWNLVTGTETKRHQKVIDVETGQVVGYARWSLPPILVKKGDVWLEAQVAEGTPADRIVYEKRYQENTRNGQPIGLNPGEMMRFRSAPLEEADARIMSDGPFLTLDYLTTDPSFWRRGIGSMLVQSGLEIADQQGVKTYVMSEPAALKLYLNLGFKLVDTVTVDYSHYGGTEPMVEYFLVREPSQIESVGA